MKMRFISIILAQYSSPPEICFLCTDIHTQGAQESARCYPHRVVFIDCADLCPGKNKQCLKGLPSLFWKEWGKENQNKYDIWSFSDCKVTWLPGPKWHIAPKHSALSAHRQIRRHLIDFTRGNRMLECDEAGKLLSSRTPISISWLRLHCIMLGRTQ